MSAVGYLCCHVVYLTGCLTVTIVSFGNANSTKYTYVEC